MMSDIFFKLPYSDLRLYYNGTFMRAKREGTDNPLRWIYVEDFGEAPAGVNVAFRDTESNTAMLPLKSLKWDFTVPPSGAYNYKNTVVLFFRSPVRQTTKGIAKSNTHFINLMRGVARAGGIPQSFYAAHDFVLSAKSLNLLFEDMEPVSYEKGLEKIARKQSLAYAVNSRISISQGIISTHPSIWLKTRVIGELDLKREIIYPLHTAFVPELLSTFVDKGLIVNQS